MKAKEAMGLAYTVHANGKTGRFVPYTDRQGGYPLYSHNKSGMTGQPIHHAANKESIPTLEEAITLVRNGTHRWRLRCPESGQYNVFAPESIMIEPM